jgi:uncharacterized damage-inducible protein DinB
MISPSPVKPGISTPPANRTMKELLSQLAAYNTWANQKLTDAILALPEEKQMQELPSSFKSLYATLLHMWDAESIWWQRMKLHEHCIAPSENFKGNMKDVVNGLLQQNRQWHDWVNSATEPMLDHVFQYYNSKREYFKQPIFQMLLHVFNHGTYHRGQLVNMLRQLAVEKIPQTDFIVFSRTKKS